MGSVSAARRVLVLRYSSAGDVLLTTPALEALATAWPDARITYVVKRAFAPLVRHHPAVHEVVVFDRGTSTLQLARDLARRRYDAILDLHGKPRGLFIKLRVPHGRSVRWKKRSLMDSALVKLGLKKYRADSTIATRYHRAVERLVGRELPRGRLRYVVGDEGRAEAAHVLDRAGVGDDRPLVGMSPGAMWETKRWPAERFGQLALRLGAAGFQVVVTGSEAEAALVREVVRVAPSAIDLAGKSGLSGLGGILERCTAFVANDSGPMHMARGLGVPTLAFFGSTDPGQFTFASHGLMWAHTECAPCSLYGRARCPKSHFRCMNDLTVDAAWKGLEPLLDGQRRPLPEG